MIPPATIFQQRYKVSEPIGVGGMQTVYRAEDFVIGRTVALKTPLPGQEKKFADSARISAMVNHHGVAKTYDYFENEGTQYLIEEFVSGPDLKVLFPDGKWIDPHLGARIFLELAKGLAASHAAGVIHRDLKPSNLLSVAGQPLAEVKITDFGIATLADEVFQDAVKSGDITKSTSGTVKGALPYMSPEMMFRKVGDHPGKKADVWSLGAVMFRLMTGKVPFGYGFEAALNVGNNNRENWPAFMVSNPHFADLSLGIQAIIESCLVREVKSRPSASDLIAKLETVCFSSAPRSLGVVTQRNGLQGRIRSDTGHQIFFHRDSVYTDSPIVVGRRVSFSAFPGSPYPRAHPVVPID